MTDLHTLPAVLQFTVWTDDLPAVFDTDSDLALVFLTPTLGPTATLVLHHVAKVLRHNQGVIDGPCLIEADYLAGSLGVNQATLARALERLDRFGYAHTHPSGAIAVRLTVAHIPQRHQERWPAELRTAYAYLNGAHT
jgi:hypothetical protein